MARPGRQPSDPITQVVPVQIGVKLFLAGALLNCVRGAEAEHGGRG